MTVESFLTAFDGKCICVQDTCNVGIASTLRTLSSGRQQKKIRPLPELLTHLTSTHLWIGVLEDPLFSKVSVRQSPFWHNWAAACVKCNFIRFTTW